ncbi:succinate dehydrogenase, cytochrome b556 subunit [Rhodoblastus sp. 17X3]|uniref:succinate dehydrogenase, cytochrome b556 subunit n=1 Tax=Rhodoblastus sp. 17X3 TaxID=3047026 RepID=UPI0024B658BC|nr:succinate dehydrogenase, cytochrome b556 subunit [Rhodoblastus sp. 17X3]MDI9849286.1 succinate dehydrogenase, cytochrome b556 subunit [Rhodoblastus sp. 17X3]
MAEAEPSSIPLEQRRPLSPHMQIYKWSPTMAASIAHRVTGAALYAGTLLLAAYLLAAAGDAHSFNFTSAIFGSFLGQLVLFGYTFALLLHLMGGLRHAIWDAGKGFDAESRDRLAIGSFAAAGVLTVLLWIVSFIIR